MRKNKQLSNNSIDELGLHKTGTQGESSSIPSERFVMNKQYSKRMFAQLIFYSLLLNTLTPIVSLADTSQRATRCNKELIKAHTAHKICNSKKINCNSCCKPEPEEIFDFVVVGAGNTGCVIANRLSKDGKYTVCLLDAGRDDARLPELLPEPSAANIPQPGDYHWGQYTRGGVFLTGPQTNRGFGNFHFYENSDNRPNGTKSISYARYAGWGGCTSINTGINVRNAPYNWDQWVALGLTDWDASTPTSPLIKYYKMIENRSFALFGTFFPLYNPALPLGDFGGFDPAWYGFDGEVPIAHVFPDEYTNALQSIVNTTLSSFGYPKTLIDLDYPPTAADGGLGLENFTQTIQINQPTVTKPGTAPAPGDFSNNVPLSEYNPYGDVGFKVPEEFQNINNPTFDPAALFLIQKTTAANTYLYAAENRPNLAIKSEVLVTNLIIKDKKAHGVEYLDGWNIYQAGRNPATSQAGYGGTVADAKYNALFAQKEGKHKVFAKKAVVLCAGSFNTPQILMLSGIGNKFDLEPLGIKSTLHLPGVGQHLIDNQEIFLFWEKPAATPLPSSLNMLAAFNKPTDKALGIPPMWDISIYEGNYAAVYCEAQDPFVQKGWVGLKGVPGIYDLNTRNTFHNILLDPTNVNTNPGPITATYISTTPPTLPNTGPWLVQFSIPSTTLSSGGFNVSDSTNANYNRNNITAQTFLPSGLGTNVPDQTGIVLAYQTDPGTFLGATATITPNPAFLPVMVDPNNVMGMTIIKNQNNRSQGFVKLQSNDPTVPPLIFMNMLSDPQDLQEYLDLWNNTVLPMFEALQYTTPTYFRNFLFPAPSDILVDGTDPLAPFSTANVDQTKLKNFLFNETEGHHAGGTCKMGVANDPMAVVDQHGKVFGLKNLYVADMSVVPVSIRWPNGTCYVIGEKIAADILAAYA